MRPLLAELAAHHGTDKELSRHGYVRHYEPLFAPRRDEALTLLEIGVFSGASHRMWRDYFPNARVCGIDCEESARQHAGERLQIFIGNEDDVVFLERVLGEIGPPDIIIDDGSHWGQSQATSFAFLYPRLRPGGIYLIEDVHTSYWGDHGPSYLPHLHGQIDQVLHPCPAVHADHADRRNSPHWAEIAPRLTDFERETKRLTLHTGLIIYEKWQSYEL